MPAWLPGSAPPANVIVGATTVMVKSFGVLVPALSVAVTRQLVTPVAVGVPVIALLLKERPAGRVQPRARR